MAAGIGEMNGPGGVRLDGGEMPTITEALRHARVGSTIAIGRGQYGPASETFPLQIPAGVTLRGPEPPDRNRELRKLFDRLPPAAIVSPPGATAIVCDAANGTVAHLSIRSAGSVDSLVSIGAVARCVLDSCTVAGTITWVGSQAAELRWSTITLGQLVAESIDGLAIIGGTVTGVADDPLVDVRNSTDVRLEALALHHTDRGIIARACENMLISGCAILTQECAVDVHQSSDVTVSGNRVRGANAIRFTDCHDGSVYANGVEWADVAITLRGCNRIVRDANHFADVRVDILDDAN